MNATPITDLIDQMLEVGLGRAAVVVAVRALETSLIEARDGHARKRDMARDRQRRRREKLKQSQGQTEANDAVTVTPSVTQETRDTPELRLMKGTSESQSGNREVRKKDTASVNGRAEKVSRGTRLSPGILMPAEWADFAASQGMTRSEIEKAFPEFVDYWTAIPGGRGTKLDWFATWRNRVRQLTAKGKTHGRPTKPSLTELAFDLAGEARELEHQAGIGRPPDTF